MFKLVLEKAEEPEIKLPTYAGSQKKEESSRKTSTSALLTTLVPLTVWITTNCKKLLQIWTADHLAHLLRNMYAGQEAIVRTGHGTRTGSKLGKEYIKAVHCHPAYLIYMQSISCEMPGWMNHKLYSIYCREKYQQPQICRWYHPHGRKWRGTKEPLDEGERRAWKGWLKTQHSKKQRSWHLVPSLHGKQMGKQWKWWQTLFLGAPKSLQMVTAWI